MSFVLMMTADKSLPFCVSDIEGKTCPPCREGTLAEFNMDTMGILTEIEEYSDECWLSIAI